MYRVTAAISVPPWLFHFLQIGAWILEPHDENDFYPHKKLKGSKSLLGGELLVNPKFLFYFCMILNTFILGLSHNVLVFYIYIRLELLCMNIL